MDSNHLIVLTIGLVGSLTVHLSQGLLKLALLRRATGSRNPGNAALYTTGLVLNFSAPLWVIVANRFGPTVLYTSMYASGLLGLILFSCWKLNRPIRALEILGALLTVAGSAVVVFAYNQTEILGMETTAPVWLLGAGLVLALLVLPFVRLAERWHTLPVGLVIGGFGGAFLALDSLLKGVAQAEGGAGGFLPISSTGWALFAISFLGAAAALGMTQWAHVKEQAPTATIAAYDAAYVALPILLLPIAQGQGVGLNPLCFAGLGIIVTGLFCIGRVNRGSALSQPRGKQNPAD